MKPRASEPGRSRQQGGAARVALVVIALLVLAGTAWIWYQRQAAPPTVATAPPASTGPADGAPPAPAPAASEPAIRHPVEPAASAASAAAPLSLGQAITALVGTPAGRSMLQLSDFPRRFVATIDNLGRAHAPPSIWPLEPAPGRFTTTARAGEISLIAPSNSERYDPLVRLIESIDVRQAATLYRAIYPQLQEAYRQLGFPNGYFNDRFVDVIDLLLATPEVDGPIEVRLTEVKGPVPSTRPWVRYEYVDPQLEALAAGQKILLRVGPEYRKRLKARLVAVRAALTNPLAPRS